jgi:predicted  nucleic acid-binding Zn-ribbon protein
MCELLNRMANSSGEREAGDWSNMRPHDEFLELCAVSTSGDLTEEEQNKLNVHLAGCPDCRQALKEFEAAVDVGVPLLASKLSPVPSEESESSSKELVERVLSKDATSESSQREAASVCVSEEKRGFAFAQRNGRGRTQVNWNYVWMPFAACILLMIALGIYAYRVGQSHNSEVAHVTSVTADGRLEALEQRINNAGHEREVLRTQLVDRDKVIAELRRQTEQQSKSLEEMQGAQANLERSRQADEADKKRVEDERARLAQNFDTAQASLQKMQSELDSARRQRVQDEAQDASLQSQIKDLSGQLQEQRQTAARQDELLSHDRDIRDLMGARDLYVAEVYDVKRDGSTQKSYGRVFYTKGKSLIFYAYDLNEEPGVLDVSTFQAWGRRGPDRQKALNLGVFYEDSAAKKRWVLKFDNPKALAEIDAVFVTIEPKGGSLKPSGKPLLYAYLHLSPNHP